MKPEELSSSQSGMSLSKQGPMSDASNEIQSQEAAAQIIRSQIDSLFDNEKPVIADKTLPAQSTQFENVNPYQRTHSERPSPTANDWKQYHTAWQNYYQKYYEGYYKHSSKTAANEPAAQKDTANSRTRSISRNTHNYFANHATSPVEAEPKKTLSNDEAIFDMRQELLGKIQNSAKKVRKSRHFIPLVSGLAVILLFVFLQYNRLLISNVVAYVSPGNIDPQNIVINPNADIVVGPESRLIIPKINVDVPVLYDVGNDYNSQMAAMSNGVAHFAVPGASSHPGQVGNTVIAGHSSNDLLDPGDYKFIFAQLDKLNVGDTIYANYKSKRYTYTVTTKEVVSPTEVGKLVYPTTKPILTLLTCTPLGTSLNRLLVTSEQISPDPVESVAAPVVDDKSTTSIPGNSPTFLERLFGN